MAVDGTRHGARGETFRLSRNASGVTGRCSHISSIVHPDHSGRDLTRRHPAMASSIVTTIECTLNGMSFPDKKGFKLSVDVTSEQHTSAELTSLLGSSPNESWDRG